MSSGTILLLTVSLTIFGLLILRFGALRLLAKISPGVESKKVFSYVGSIIALIGFSLALYQVITIGADVQSPIIPTIQFGVLYGVLGLGLTLTYSVVKIPNFAYGEMVTIGAYTMGATSAVWHFPLPLAFLAAAFSGALLGIVQHMIVYRPLINHGTKLIQLMVASFALSLSIRSVFYMLAAYFNVVNYAPVSETAITCSSSINYVIFQCLGSPEPVLRFGDSAITDLFIGSIATTIALAAMMFLLLTRTLIGKSMRAVANNVELAQVTGINVENIRRVSWLLSGALAGVGGAFLGMKFSAGPEIGWTFLLRIFAAVTLGGLVSFSGTLVGGLVVGFGEQWTLSAAHSIFALPISWQPFIGFLIIALVLLIRPTGLSGLTIPNPLTALRSRVKKVRGTRQREA